MGIGGGSLVMLIADRISNRLIVNATNIKNLNFKINLLEIIIIY
jgi:hypothetical protein